MTKKSDNFATENDRALSKYYRFQSRIYDFTRWSFLFGRARIIRELPFEQNEPLRILEVGCGTGRNLVPLARRFPNARITGIDLSADMLAIAGKKIAVFEGRVDTVHGAFGVDVFDESFDVVLFSYCLTMVNPGWKELIRLAKLSTKRGGIVAVVDFYDSALPLFKRHMAGHHVRMEAHLLPELNRHFRVEKAKVNKAYGGVWRWFSFVGRA